MIYAAIGILIAATIGMIVWFRSQSGQAPPNQREWSPVEVPPAEFASFLAQLWDGPLETASAEFILQSLIDGETIHEATCRYLRELREGGDPESTEADPAIETAAEKTPKSTPDKAPKRRTSR